MAGLAEMGVGFAKMALRAALQQSSQRPDIVVHVARRMAEMEGVDLAKLSNAEQALWTGRARTAVSALVETIA